MFRTVQLRLPLSQLHYGGSGMILRWDEVRLLLPYDQLNLKSNSCYLLDDFKASLTGEISVSLRCHLVTGILQKIELENGSGPVQELIGLVSRVEHFVDDVGASAIKGSLTLKEAGRMLNAHNFNFSDEKTNTILSKILDQLSMQKLTRIMELPLSELQYGENQVEFYEGNTRLQAQEDQLPFKTRAIFETIKSRLQGKITFALQIPSLLKWDRATSSVLVGQIAKRVVGRGELDEESFKGFNRLRCEIVCESIKAIDLVDRSIDRVSALLSVWGLALSDGEVGQQIANTIPAWTEEKHSQVPLKEITFRDSGIDVPLGDARFPIDFKQLPFKTSGAAEKIKDIFEGEISVHLSRVLRFAWQEVGSHLIVETVGKPRVELDVDKETIVEFDKICSLYIALLEKLGPFEADKVEALIRSGPKRVASLSPTHLKGKKYNRDFLRVLETLARDVYVTSEDIWFRIGDLLVRERPIYGAATYIFDWPLEKLEHFIARIWLSELDDIRGDPKSGYVDRVFHTSVSKWETNLHRKLSI